MFSEKSKPKDFCWAAFKIVQNAFKTVLNEVDGFQSAVHRARKVRLSSEVKEAPIAAKTSSGADLIN